LALREPLRCAQNRIHRALRLRTLLPAFKRAFHRGDLSDYDVTQLVEATSCTDDPETLARVQESTLGNLRGQSGSELRRYARRLLDRLDPAAALRRARKARSEADVTLHPGEDGMASIVTDQPVEDAMIIKAAVDAKAITAKQAGDPRPIGVLRAKALTQLCAYPTSLGPASQVRAERCDVDHFDEWPDGATIETNLGPFDRPWHNRKTRGSLTVTVDDSGAVTVTTVLGQTRTVTPYDYSPHLDPSPTASDEPKDPEPPPF